MTKKYIKDEKYNVIQPRISTKGFWNNFFQSNKRGHHHENDKTE